MPKPIKHNGGTITKTRYGTLEATYNHAAIRHRQTHKTVQAAKDWIDTKALECALDIDRSTAADLTDAAEARRILGGRTSLAEAARFWIASAGTLHPITVADAVAKYMDLREADNLREASRQSIKYRLEPLAKALGPELLHTVTADQLRAMQKGSPVSRNNIRRYYLMLWAWAVKERHALTNAAEALTVAQADESLPESLSLEQVKALLRVTRETEPALMPWLCTGLFAGLRVAELARVTGAHFRHGKIHLDASITKKRDRRILNLLDPLPAWLADYPASGPLLQTNHRKRFEAIRKAAGIDPWPNNALRHSFATYHLAAFQDAGKTAHYTRHESQTTLHKHYIDLATHDDGLSYFAITPHTLDSSAESRQDLGKTSAS